VYLLALTAIKTLGRNPIGSQTLLTQPHLFTILHHTSLPLLPPTLPMSPQLSPTALEAMKILANLLVLHPAGRNRFAKLDGGKLIAEELRSGGDDGDWSESRVERVFLLGRIGFLVTMERRESVGVMVDEGDLVESLVYVSCSTIMCAKSMTEDWRQYLSTLPLIPANYSALAELLKLVNNVLRYYPSSSTSKPTSPTSDQRDDKFEP
jgi:hypothetical protein